MQLDEKIARILAHQYYSGGNDLTIRGIPQEDYIAKSTQNWLEAARGIIHLVEENFDGKLKELTEKLDKELDEVET